jgi:F-type H+-transporting ATPase subunit b
MGLPETGAHATTAAQADVPPGEHHADPTALGLNATAWVALSMAVVIAILLWKKVPAAIGRALDKKIAAIREQLDEAARLRADAEALKAEYEAKAAAAGAEAEAMLERARAEAGAIVRQAEADASALVERRGRTISPREAFLPPTEGTSAMPTCSKRMTAVLVILKNPGW